MAAVVAGFVLVAGCSSGREALPPQAGVESVGTGQAIAAPDSTTEVEVSAVDDILIVIRKVTFLESAEVLSVEPIGVEGGEVLDTRLFPDVDGVPGGTACGITERWPPRGYGGSVPAEDVSVAAGESIWYIQYLTNPRSAEGQVGGTRWLYRTDDRVQRTQDVTWHRAVFAPDPDGPCARWRWEGLPDERRIPDPFLLETPDWWPDWPREPMPDDAFTRWIGELRADPGSIPVVPRSEGTHE